MSKNNFSIIIPSARPTKVLQKTLLSLANQFVSKIGFEVIVVRNNVAETDFIVLEKIGFDRRKLRVLVVQASGPSEARNIGIAAARYSRLIFLDDDCIVSKGWLEQYQLAWKEFPTAAIIGGAVAVPKARAVLGSRFQMSEVHWCFAITQLGTTPRWLQQHEVVFSANLSLNAKRIPLTANGTFFYQELGKREKYGLVLGEDWELCLRVQALGEHIAYWPAARVHNEITPERVTAYYLLRRYWHAGIERSRAERHLLQHNASFLGNFWREWWDNFTIAWFFSEPGFLKSLQLISYTLSRLGL